MDSFRRVYATIIPKKINELASKRRVGKTVASDERMFSEKRISPATSTQSTGIIEIIIAEKYVAENSALNMWGISRMRELAALLISCRHKKEAVSKLKKRSISRSMVG